MTVNDSTIGSGGDYTTLALWEADTDNDLVAAGDIERGIFISNLTGATVDFIIGATTDISNYRELMPDVGNEYKPIAQTGRNYTFADPVSDGWNVGEGFFRVHDLLLIGGQAATTVSFVSSSDGGSIKRCYIRSTDGAALAVSGDAGDNIEIINCILDGEAASASIVGLFNLTSTADIYNCVIFSWTSFGLFAFGTCNIRNNAGTDNSVADYSVSGGTHTHNLSSDTSAPGTSSQQSKTTAATFTDASNEDFSLLTTGDAHNNGVSISGVTVDIEGNTRTSPHDIGAYISPLLIPSVSSFQYPVRGIY